MGAASNSPATDAPPSAPSSILRSTSKSEDIQTSLTNSHKDPKVQTSVAFKLPAPQERKRFAVYQRPTTFNVDDFLVWKASSECK